MLQKNLQKMPQKLRYNMLYKQLYKTTQNMSADSVYHAERNHADLPGFTFICGF